MECAPTTRSPFKIYTPAPAVTCLANCSGKYEFISAHRVFQEEEHERNTLLGWVCPRPEFDHELRATPPLPQQLPPTSVFRREGEMFKLTRLLLKQ